MISLLHLLVYYLLAELILGIVCRTALYFIYTIRYDILKDHMFSLSIIIHLRCFKTLFVTSCIPFLEILMFPLTRLSIGFCVRRWHVVCCISRCVFQLLMYYLSVISPDIAFHSQFMLYVVMNQSTT